MGAWSTDSFGNDEALDWFGDLKEADNAFGFIAETLESGSTDSIVAAGEVLAILRGKSPADVHPHVIEWCNGKSRPPEALARKADQAIQEILDDPDADGHDVWAELGEDDPDYRKWLETLRGIQTRLR
jgi:uncharacterized protein DUF4259